MNHLLRTLFATLVSMIPAELQVYFIAGNASRTTVVLKGTVLHAATKF
jgi:hypothetical protein